MLVKYRTWHKGIAPKPIKLQIPGWAGDHHRHDNGCTPQPWHCIPFVEGSTYGLELIYPFDTETKITNNGDKLLIEGDFSKEPNWYENPSPPFSNFAPGHFGFTSSLDVEAPEGHVVRIEPHPRFFTDTSGECPIAVPGHIQPWWSRIFFIVFKAPSIGQTHVFRKNEPYAQILIVPKKINYKIEKMTIEEESHRTETENLIDSTKSFIAKHRWTDHAGNKFDDKYKQLQSIFNKTGEIQKSLTLYKSLRKIKKIGVYVKKNKNNK